MASSLHPLLHPREPALAPPPSCRGSPSRVDNAKMAGSAESHEDGDAGRPEEGAPER